MWDQQGTGAPAAPAPTPYDVWHGTPRQERVPTDPDKPWLPPQRPAPPNGWTARLLVEYDGTDFVGWAKQPGQRSVEAEFERVLAQILGECPRILVGGRTDTGVHASGQVVAYDGEALAPYTLNALLPTDIAVLESAPARPGFDPRNEATGRTYRYRVLTRRERTVHRRTTTLHFNRPLDVPAMQACAAAMVGTHDFRAFTPSETLHSWFRRTVTEASWTTNGDELHFTVSADSFLRHMNRSLVGTMLDVGLGARRVEDFTALLEGAPRARAGWSAPATGLSLERISYPG